MKEIKELGIGLENCEYITIPRNVIGRIIIDGIREKIQRVACNSIASQKIADTVVIEIYKEGNTTYESFPQDDEPLIFDRINQYDDITMIEVVYEDDTVDEFYVKYDVEEDYLGAPNTRQKSKISELGNLYLVIDDEHFEKWFVDEDINNEEKVEADRYMFDIGVEYYEMHDYSADDLPDMYRYVFLIGADDKTCIAMRVYDTDCDWKFIYEPSATHHVHCPVRWQYPDSKTENKMKIGEVVDSSFSLGAILNKYPKKG